MNTWTEIICKWIGVVKTDTTSSTSSTSSTSAPRETNPVFTNVPD